MDAGSECVCVRERESVREKDRCCGKGCSEGCRECVRERERERCGGKGCSE